MNTEIGKNTTLLDSNVNNNNNCAKLSYLIQRTNSVLQLNYLMFELYNI
jgi:hypothetical protein